MTAFEIITQALPYCSIDEQLKLRALLNTMLPKVGPAEVDVPRPLMAALVKISKYYSVHLTPNDLMRAPEGKKKLKQVVKLFEENDWLQEQVIYAVLRFAILKKRELGHLVIANTMFTVLFDYGNWLDEAFPSYKFWKKRGQGASGG